MSAAGRLPPIPKRSSITLRRPIAEHRALPDGCLIQFLVLCDILSVIDRRGHDRNRAGAFYLGFAIFEWFSSAMDSS